MELTEYFDKAPVELNILDHENDYKLLKVFAFNAYFDVDMNRILPSDDEYEKNLEDGITYERHSKGDFIDGVFINETLDEDAIECLYSYYVGNNSFDIGKIKEKINSIIKLIINTTSNRYVGLNDKAQRLIRYYLEQKDEDNNESMYKTIVIRIITDYSTPYPYTFLKEIESLETTIGKIEVKATISFGDEIESIILSNKAPFDYVEEGRLNLDEPNNFLRYRDNSIVCNISAKSLQKLWTVEGNKGLLAMNLRYYVKSKNIDTKIEESIVNDGDNFWYLNNGIIIVCEDFNIVNKEIRLKRFSIVNGGQTSRMIGCIKFQNDFYISCKIIRNTEVETSKKNEFVAKVAEASNTQKPIKIKDIIANRPEQRNLKSQMKEANIFVEVKRGDKCNKEIYKEPWQKIKNNELAQALFSFIYLQPGAARRSVSKLLENQEKYDTIFKYHIYPSNFLKNIIFLDKAYRDYKRRYSPKAISRDNPLLSAKANLVANSHCYCLATIGYILKFKYNPSFVNEVKINFNKENEWYKITEMAFDNTFIDGGTTYNQFRKDAFKLFDYVFDYIILPEYEKKKETTAPSNWTKADTGFKGIMKRINDDIFYDQRFNYVGEVSKCFIEPSQAMILDNQKKYNEYIRNNKKNKDSVPTSNNEDLRNKLMMFNMKHKHGKDILTDDVIGKIVNEKPTNREGLLRIIRNSNKVDFYGDEIIKIIIDSYLN